jgi:predicted PurR-regulated permease PerM
MTTIVNNPATTDQGFGNSVAVAIVLVLFVFAGILFFMYGLPALRGGYGNTTPQAMPQPQTGSQPQSGSQVPQINIPDKIDVNLNQQK